MCKDCVFYSLSFNDIKKVLPSCYDSVVDNFNWTMEKFDNLNRHKFSSNFTRPVPIYDPMIIYKTTIYFLYC